MKRQHNVLFAAEIAELYTKLAFAFDGGKIEVGSEVSYSQGHSWQHTSRGEPGGGVRPRGGPELTIL